MGVEAQAAEREVRGAVSSHYSLRPASLLLAAAFALLCLLQLAVTEPYRSFAGFKEISWQGGPGCSVISSSQGSDSNLARALIAIPDGKNKRSSCISKPLTAAGDTLELFYAVQVTPENPLKAKFSVTGPNGTIASITPGKGARDGMWRRFKVPLQSVKTGTPLRVRLSAAGQGPTIISLRSRADFYQSGAIGRIRDGLKSNWILCGLSALIAACLVLPLFCSTRSPSRWRLALTVFAVSALVQFRQDPFFFADEWLFLKRLHEQGLSAILLRHNEHFVPVFSLVYYLEYLLFGDGYAGFTLVSAILVGVNSVLIALLLRSLCGEQLAPNVEWFAALFYGVNGLHSEAAEWALSQSSILSAGFALAAALLFVFYIKTGRKALLAALAVSVSASILSFAIGFILALYLLSLFLYLQFCTAETKRRAYSHRLLLLTLLFAFVISASLYLSHPDGYKHQALNKQELPEITEFIEFVRVGSFFGTFLRGSSLFPLPEVQRLYPMLQNQSYAGFHQLRGWLSDQGLFFAMLLLVLYLRLPPESERRRRGWLWGLGFVWAVSPMIVIAAGRWQLGDENALAFRYQEFPLLGLVLLVTPLFSKLLEIARASASGTSRRISSGALVCLLAVQIAMGASFTHFTELGRSSREFKIQLKDWLAGFDEANDPASKDAVLSMRPLIYLPSGDYLREPEISYRDIAELVD